MSRTEEAHQIASDLNDQLEVRKAEDRKLSPQTKPLTESQFRKLIDEGGPLVEKVKKLAARLKEIKDRIAERAKDLPPDKDATYPGNRFIAEVGAREFKRKITDMPAVQKAVDEKYGPTTFVRHAELAMKALDLLLPDALDRGFVVKERTGNREIKIVPKPPAERKVA